MGGARAGRLAISVRVPPGHHRGPHRYSNHQEKAHAPEQVRDRVFAERRDNHEGQARHHEDDQQDVSDDHASTGSGVELAPLLLERLQRALPDRLVRRHCPKAGDQQRD